MQAEEALKLIMDKKFVLDCPQLLLSPQLSTSSRKSYSGAGFVSQDEEGHFILRIYGVEGLQPFEGIEDFFSIKAGEIISEEYYYELSATDISGKQWKAKWIWRHAHIKEYEDLRHRLAHGYLVSEVQLQTYLDRCASVLVLFYHLVFSTIKYSGEYTDYSRRNYPLRRFPMH
jgi:hypothetical protein